MKTIGLTGGIGSGKSTVADVFSTLNVPVFKADESGRRVLDTDADVIMQVKSLLGDDAYDEKGQANRPFIASKVFQDEQLLHNLNQIIHPAVGRDFLQWKAKQSHAFCIREAAILFESGTHQDCDQVICVLADESVRIARVMKRDAVNEEAVKARMAKQWPPSKKEAMSDYIIQNNGSESLISQVTQIHQDLIES